MSRESIGVLIRRYRGDVSQERLAVSAGTDSKAVGEIENGGRNAGWSTIARLLAVLNVPGDDIAQACRYEMEAYTTADAFNAKRLHPSNANKPRPPR